MSERHLKLVPLPLDEKLKREAQRDREDARRRAQAAPGSWCVYCLFPGQCARAGRCLTGPAA